VRILVADDTAFWRMKVADILAGSEHCVRFVEDGEAAWQILCDDPDIDLLITDWEMPRTSGVELCRRLRARPREPYLPIILLTSRGEKEDLTEGLNAGADAFVTKPIHDAELLAQIGVAERILKLESDLASKVRDVTVAKARLDRDLEAAAEVQRSLLPAEPPLVPGVDFGWVYESCDQVGGDMFNVTRLAKNLVGLYVLDVSGHGTPAALLSVGLSHVLTPFPEQGGILRRGGRRGDGEGIVPPREVAEELNRRYPLIERSGQYVTFLYGILDLSDLTFRFVRAGHPGPVQLTAKGALSHDDGGGIPIGIRKDVRYRDEVLALSPGDGVVFYTDGATEATNERDQEYGLPRLLEALSRRDGRLASRLVRVRSDIEEFAKGGRLRDDFTMVGVELA
jgi:sigma-B regulation protein RsbU (phosphoserine phosphatase)